MISLDVGGCRVDIISVVRGLISESQKVEAVLNNEYDVFSVALGKEDIAAVIRREEFADHQIVEDADLVYLHYLERFGKVAMPTPAYTTMIDRCSSNGTDIMPLEMDDDTYTKVYCDTVSTFEIIRETKRPKQAMKHKFTMDSPEEYVIEWDKFMNHTKGMKELNSKREKYIAGRIKVLSRGKKRLLALLEVERLNGVLETLGGAAL